MRHHQGFYGNFAVVVKAIVVVETVSVSLSTMAVAVSYIEVGVAKAA
jgi:hypothetical protein